MYDMYPDSWGPAKNRTPYDRGVESDERHRYEALQASIDLRDNGGQRPDDN